MVDVAWRGAESLARCAAVDYPLIILDRMLPDINGLDVCRTLRQSGNGACVLMLTARNARQDKLRHIGGLTPVQIVKSRSRSRCWRGVSRQKMRILSTVSPATVNGRKRV